MTHNALRLTLAVAVALSALLVGCETYTCRSACTRIYDECAVPAFLPCESSETNVDCNAAGEWEAHQQGQCIQDCEAALYTLTSGDENDEDGSRRGLYDEEDATRFVNCVVNSECNDLLRDASDCGILW